MTQEHIFESFYTMSANKGHFKKEKHGQSLFKKYAKFQKFDEILYCGITRFRNVKLGFLDNIETQKLFQKIKTWAESF